MAKKKMAEYDGDMEGMRHEKGRKKKGRGKGSRKSRGRY